MKNKSSVFEMDKLEKEVYVVTYYDEDYDADVVLTPPLSFLAAKEYINGRDAKMTFGGLQMMKIIERNLYEK
jgi:hypothetical protein